jgi:hypothetical protein
VELSLKVPCVYVIVSKSNAYAYDSNKAYRGLVKVGISKNLKRRMRVLATEWDRLPFDRANFEVTHVWEGGAKAVRQIELSAKKDLAAHLAPVELGMPVFTEWFTCEPCVAIAAVERALSLLGRAQGVCSIATGGAA